MVILLFLLTVIVFLSIDYFLHKEEKAIQEAENGIKSPIFLSPQKALTTIAQKEKQLFHLSHSWIQPYDSDHFYLGFDNFIPSLFTSDIKINSLPKTGSYINQGEIIWNINSSNHTISQLSPISGYVLEINPACTMGIPLPSMQLAKSWILKIKSHPKPNEIHNLMNYKQADIMLTALKDELILTAEEGHFLNDGGTIDPTFISHLSESEWQRIIKKFFPYMIPGLTIQESIPW